MTEIGGTFRRRLCVTVDIQGYSGHGVPWQVDAQRSLALALDEAAQRCGLRRDDWWRQESGDGEIAVIDDDAAEPVVIEQFPSALTECLRAVTGKGEPRVRLAVHHGVTVRAAAGYAGDGVVEVSRIVDSEAVKDALDAAPGANLVLALSERTFLDVVRTRLTGLHPADFWSVPVRNKTYRGTVWLTVPGAEPSSEPTHGQAQEAADPGPAPSTQQIGTGHFVIQGGHDVRIGSLTTVDGDLYAPLKERPRG